MAIDFLGYEGSGVGRSINWIETSRRVARSISENRLVANSGSVAFFALLAVFPAIATVVSLYGLISDPRAIASHLSALAEIVPKNVLDLINHQVAIVAAKGNRTLSLTFLSSFVIALWSANSGTSALFDALNVVYGKRETRGTLRFYATSLALTFALAAFAVAALVGVVILPVIWKFVVFLTPAQGLFEVLRWPVLFVVVATILAILYRFGPSKPDARFHWVSWGSLFGAAAWICASILFSWYVGAFDSYNKLYGSLGTIIGFMTWIWFSVLIVLIGAALNAEIGRQSRERHTQSRS